MRHMKLYGMVFGVLALVLAAGCNDQKTEQVMVDDMSTEGLEESEALGQAFDALVEDMVATTDRPLPADAGDEGFAESLQGALEFQYPALLMAEPDQAAAFDRGEFNDEANIEKMNDMLARIAEQDIALPTFSGYLVDAYYDQKLTGAGLEIATRLIEFRLQQRS